MKHSMGRGVSLRFSNPPAREGERGEERIAFFDFENHGVGVREENVENHQI